jgi:UDP-N-acetylglucosamine 2-epimerase
MRNSRIGVVIGTRPEAIKMAPVILQLQRAPALEPVVISTGQHRDLIHEMLGVFGLAADVDLQVMKPGANLNALTGAVLSGIDRTLSDLEPALVVVHGDTTSSAAAALAAYNMGIPVAHVEAGLRTGNLGAPWPEEGNRRLIDAVSTLHLAPTNEAANNLQGSAGDNYLVSVTGNTVIDALFIAVRILEGEGTTDLEKSWWSGNSGSMKVLVTLHRREHFGVGHGDVIRAIEHLASRDIQFVIQVHPNPKISHPLREAFDAHEGVTLISPLNYIDFVRLMRSSDVLLTDSGGLQEEGPALGKPVLVTREVSERPEAIACGAARIVGTAFSDVVDALLELQGNQELFQSMATAGSPYGDGEAASRVVSAIEEFIQRPVQ